MSSKAEKERQKQIQDKCQKLLTQMLRDDDNKYCVDCDAKGPRWASWNLGIFLCIRCAGIHRNLGVHISKVKSVNLDTWTPEQVVSLQQMGNSRARAVYEANLPDNFRRPQSDSALEAFVRAKYEAKKYIAREWVPPPIPKVNWDKELEEEAERGRKKKKQQDGKILGQTQSVRKLDNVIPQPLPKPNTSPKTTQRINSSSNSSQLSQQNKPPSTDLLGLDTPLSDTSNTASSTDEMFSSFLSAPLPDSSGGGTNAPKRTPEEDSFFNQHSSTSSTTEKKQLTTDSILALYGKSQPAPCQPAVNNAFTMQGPGGFIGSGFQTASTVPTAAYQIPNGMIQMQQVPSVRGAIQPGVIPGGGIYPMMVGPQAAVAAAASNPFYSMATIPPQPMNFNSSVLNPASANVPTIPANAMRLPQQMAALSLQSTSAGGTTMPHATGQTLASNLWQ
ncbi:stromal membrane-associated protein 1-like [Lycorma delicatula]|uniref:stromal membrane-associated protein 1-like n=1 Tax=Lycorma delicatula TaxID=130591 RepID=UPI003F511E5E